MRQPADHRVPHGALASATTAPLVRIYDPAGQDCTTRLQALSHDVETELVQTDERGQVKSGQGR